MAVIYAFIKGTFKNVQSKLFVRKKYSNHRRNRHYFSANGPFLLLPLALKWGLSILLAIVIVPCIMAKGAYAASLTVEVPRDPLSVTVSADGTAKESSPANVTVTSDAYWGYTLSVKSNDANGALTNGNSKINSIGTGIASLSQFTNNIWGFKVSGEGVTDPNNYRQGPTTATTNLAVTTGQKGLQETGTYSFTLAAKVDNTIPIGTYTGTFTFMATSNAVNYTINYDDNNGADGPGKVTSQSQEQFVKIAAKEPTKQDRVFLGWCDQEVSNNGTCDGTIYQPGNDYEIKTADQNTTLHAMWDWITMQNWDDCSKNLAKNKQFTLVDSRDNKPYYIAKLADDNCWMTENLDYDIVAGVTLTAETTDLGYATDEDKGENVDEYGNYQWTPEKSTYKDTMWDSSLTNARSYDPGDYCWNGTVSPSWVETYYGWLDNQWEEDHTINCKRHLQGEDGTNPHYYLGNYYNVGASVA